MSNEDPKHAEFCRRCDEFPDWMRKAAMGDPALYAVITRYALGGLSTKEEAYEWLIKHLMGIVSNQRESILRLSQMQPLPIFSVNPY